MVPLHSFTAVVYVVVITVFVISKNSSKATTGRSVDPSRPSVALLEASPRLHHLPWLRHNQV